MLTMLPPVCRHALAEGLAAVPHAVQIHVEDLAPLVGGDLERRPVHAGAGIVDQDVDAAELRDDRVHRPVHLGPAHDVGLEPLRDDSALGQLADDPVGGGPVPGEDRHPGARLAERRREGLTQSAVASGDDGDPAVEVQRCPAPTS